MTKPRAPLTFPQAITRVLGLVTVDDAAKLVDRSPRLVGYWSEPDRAELPTLEQAVTLDLAYVALGGDGYPIFETYALRIETELADRLACHRELADAVAASARECGDAIAASATVIGPGATTTQVHRAIGETEEGISRLTAMLRCLKGFMSVGAGKPGAPP